MLTPPIRNRGSLPGPPPRPHPHFSALPLPPHPPPAACVRAHAKATRVVGRCGNVAAILELDEHLQKEFIIFEAAPQETRGIPSKKPVADYFL